MPALSVLRRLAVCAAATALAVLPACGGTTELEGSVRATGSSTVRPILSAAAGRFAIEQPFVTINLDAPGTANGFALFCDGLADMTGASRPMSSREQDLCEQSDVSWVELTIGVDAIVVFVASDNPPATCLDSAELYALVGPESGGLSTWRDAADLAAEVGDAKPVNLIGAGDTELAVVGPDAGSGTLPTFVELAIGPTATLRDKAVGLRPDARAVAADSGILNAVAAQRGAVGFNGYASLGNAPGIVQPVAIDGGDGCVLPTEDSVNDGTYPLTRRLYVYVRTDGPDHPSEATRGLVDALISDAGLKLADELGGLPLSPQVIDQTREVWAGIPVR